MKKTFNDFACYISIILTVVILVITNVLPIMGLNVPSQATNILEEIAYIALVVGVAFGALAYAKGSFLKQFIFWLAIAAYVAIRIYGVV